MLLLTDTNCLAEVRSTQRNDQGHANQDALENIYTDDEEEEEELDGYESPTLVYCLWFFHVIMILIFYYVNYLLFVISGYRHVKVASSLIMVSLLSLRLKVFDF